ncbi:thiamine diphosphokinase [Roseovarius dicentrarchi]|uniref:thiamine diphosphokinase n=1 Tax=Roseovarius dicentrarchi TaxID=2250573 RepID=UPI000DEAC03C|nr:thiamine diphosphokinase [Roseovarius dicentrarchi]
MIVHSSAPVALIGGAPVCETALAFALSRAGRIVAADGGAATAHAREIALDAVIGDFDSIPADVRGAYPAEILHPIEEQDSTDFEKCLTRIAAPLILGVGFSGARLDHELAACNALVRWPARRCMLIGPQDVMFLAPPSFALDLAPGTRVSLFPMGAVEGRSDGLNWPIDGLTLTPDGQIGTSNFATGPVAISVTAPKLLVILPAGHAGAVGDMLMSAPARWP